MTSEKKFDQIKYQNEYNRKNYDHINIMVAKGKKDIVKAKAKEKGGNWRKKENGHDNYYSVFCATDCGFLFVRWLHHETVAADG